MEDWLYCVVCRYIVKKMNSMQWTCVQNTLFNQLLLISSPVRIHIKRRNAKYKKYSFLTFHLQSPLYPCGRKILFSPFSVKLKTTQRPRGGREALSFHWGGSYMLVYIC